MTSKLPIDVKSAYRRIANVLGKLETEDERQRVIAALGLLYPPDAAAKRAVVPTESAR